MTGKKAAKTKVRRKGKETTKDWLMGWSEKQKKLALRAALFLATSRGWMCGSEVSVRDFEELTRNVVSVFDVLADARRVRYEYEDYARFMTEASENLEYAEESAEQLKKKHRQLSA